MLSPPINPFLTSETWFTEGPSLRSHFYDPYSIGARRRSYKPLKTLSSQFFSPYFVGRTLDEPVRVNRATFYEPDFT